MSRIAAFVPIKLLSRRLPNKNFLILGQRPLAYHIFSTLSQIDVINEVFCYTSQQQILDLLPKDIALLTRPKSLDGDDVNANELFRFAVEKIDADILILCHATGPFIEASSIKKGLEAVKSGDYDCSFSVQAHRTYAWYKDEPLNYDRTNIAQTQQLEPVYSETSGFYIFRKSNYLESGSRIGKKPYFVEVTEKEAIDIDEPADFNLAQHMLDYKILSDEIKYDDFFINLANLGFKNKNVEHVSFDMDGVLIDSIELMEKAWCFTMDKLNLDYKFEEYRKYIGIPFFSILENMNIPKNLNEDILDLYDGFCRENVDLIKAMPGSQDQIERLKLNGLKTSVVTSKNKLRAIEIIENLFDEELFDIVVSPEDIPSGRGKPHPDPLLYACIQMGVDPFNSIYIGDMDVDKLAAERAGFHFVYANWGYGDLKKVQDVWFDNMFDLADYIVG